ncbi:hypothetical protein C8J57DRAFT_1247367 [Mycena rebaudengoi]|nr:hypothetical protein C8J57DRAFT_1247367 [Mycena rebaudengoi]
MPVQEWNFNSGLNRIPEVSRYIFVALKLPTLLSIILSNDMDCDPLEVELNSTRLPQRPRQPAAVLRQSAAATALSPCPFFCTYPKIIGIFGMDFDIVMGRLGAKSSVKAHTFVTSWREHAQAEASDAKSGGDCRAFSVWETLQALQWIVLDRVVHSGSSPSYREPQPHHALGARREEPRARLARARRAQSCASCRLRGGNEQGQDWWAGVRLETEPPTFAPSAISPAWARMRLVVARAGLLCRRIGCAQWEHNATCTGEITAVPVRRVGFWWARENE